MALQDREQNLDFPLRPMKDFRHSSHTRLKISFFFLKGTLNLLAHPMEQKNRSLPLESLGDID